jgi:DNA polymerase I-like protein with 3'-5' exonuclease and polymerase domains
VKNRGEGAIGNFAASPFCKDNYVVLWGAAYGYEGGVSVFHKGTAPSLVLRYLHEARPVLLIGHNIGFDLLHLFQQMGELWMQRYMPYIRIWDTQHAEYLLSGQTKMYPSLNDCALARGLDTKDDKIAAYWAAGTETEHIPSYELEQYNAYDVELTRAVFLDQWAAMEDNPALLNLMRVKMEDKLSTIWMEYNGMAFDLERAWTLKGLLESEVVSLERDAQMYVPYSWPAGVDFDISKNEHISAAIFGGTIKVEYVDVLPEKYKTGAKAGQNKTRKADRAYVVPENTEPHVLAVRVPTKKPGVYKTDDEVLSALRASEWGLPSVVLAWRGAKKDITTYYEGYSKLVWPDGVIHPSINHEATRTGRQSCTNPNLQNVSKGEEE